MKGKVLDLNQTDVFISFEDGTTMDISTSRLPNNVKVGDVVDIPISTTSSINSDTFLHDRLTNNKLSDFF
ncbi:hypothetical protein CPJCM30710_17050 [Clostridium polyendosporum]|uniref:DUF3006 family protein n=1 Tax=Clostridium polyendosporum TaxID=69208 RepID=A0A919VED6_9CLOT|nr:hypothetical protein [Clostridium polyendosporum]GIM29039.1 hypothetical protein CPJCM30710_17050 [Clostridium polyendosporum]